jgi:putative hemolysin
MNQEKKVNIKKLEQESMAKPQKNIKYIDIAKILEERNVKLLNNVPKFVINWIAKIIRQDEMNNIINKYSGYSEKDFIAKMIEEFNLKLVIEGKENLPKNGRCFFAANHPYGILDGMIITHIVSEKYGSLKAIANDAFMLIPQLHAYIATVNVFDSASKAYLKVLNDIYKSEIPITHFPAGEVSRIYNKKIQDSAWHKSFISKAISNKRDIIPIYFYGRNSNLFYSIFILRQLLGIKLNVELILLPHEFFRKRDKTIKVKIGKPISYEMFDNSLSHREWAQKVRLQVYNLKNNN